MSIKVSQDVLSDCMTSIVESASRQRRKRLENIELWIKLKDPDPDQHKRLFGKVKMKHAILPRSRACIVGDEKHCEEAEANNLNCIDLQALKNISKSTKSIRALARVYDIFLVSTLLISQVNCLMGYGLSALDKSPINLTHTQPISAQVDQVRTTAKIRRKAGHLVVAVGNVKMTPENLVANTNQTVRCVTKLLKKHGSHVHSVCVRTIMGPILKIF
ncbi:large ribosomal subunit protein uL1-like [Amblyomma americanum]